MGGTFRSLYAMESPDVRFEDFIYVKLRPQDGRIQIDPLFVEACETGSIHIRSLVSETDDISHCRCTVLGSDILWFPSKEMEGKPVSLGITITGIRANSTWRFGVRTVEEAEHVRKFWSQNG